MKETLRFVLAVPLVAWVCYMTFVPLEKIKSSWFMAGLGYGVGYVAIFYFWLKMK
jgi:hypothetical protein